MTGEGFKRKLTTILSADVAEYSRLMGEDETATVKMLTSYRQVMTELIKQHRGRVIDSPGDNLLAEFTSVVDAVQCSLAVQKELQARNAGLPENRRMQFRIGINLGDVIEEEDRIYGDGVNIAARLEALAEPGGICISKTAFDQIETKLPLGYKYLGEQEVKNITKPVGAYQVLMEPRVTITEEIKREKAPPIWRRKTILAGGVAFIVLVIAALIWNFYFRPPPIQPASKEKMAYPLPDKPSIAVLPFVNMSDDPEQEYFGDGMTEDLITDLSKISGIFVIARNSTFSYKGKPVKIRQVAEELGVRYVLEGSVRRAGNQVRINAQLIDTTTGHHLWAERYDGSMNDVFGMQDKINQKITSALAVKLTVGEKELVGQKGTNDPAAYEELLRGRVHYLRNTTEDFSKAEAGFKRAIQLDPNSGQARAALAMLYFDAATQRKEAAFKISYFEARLRARQYLREAMKEPTSIAYQVGGLMDVNLRQHDEAVSQLEKALALDPNDPACLAAMSRVLSISGRPAEGMEYGKDAMRLDPLNPGRYLAYIGIAHFCMGEWQETVTMIKNALKLNPELRAFAGYLASAYAHLGRDDEAKAAAQTFRRGSPARRFFAALPAARPWMFFYPFKDRRVADSFLESLKRAGLLAPGPEYIHVSKKDQLTGAELRAFYCPSTITGLMPDGSVWSEETTKDGTTTYRAPFFPGGPYTGKKWFEGDKVWTQYSKFLFGMAFCRTTFKNPRGSHEGKDEYVRFSDLAVIPFSRVR